MEDIFKMQFSVVCIYMFLIIISIHAYINENNKQIGHTHGGVHFRIIKEDPLRYCFMIKE